MFQTGTKYEFRMIEGEDEILFWGTIESYEHPIIKIQDEEISVQMTSPGGETETLLPPTRIPGKIINVTSPHFISAVAQNADGTMSGGG